jgi:hypothetical protein
MIGTFYNVQVLVDLVQNVLIKRLHDIDPASLFHFLVQFREPLIREQSDVFPPDYRGPNLEELRTSIRDGLDALKKSQLLFVETIISNFSVLLDGKKTQLLSSITPWLLIKVLTEMHDHMPNSELVELIEAFVRKLPKHLLTEDDRSEFNSLIDWHDEKIYPFFLKYNLDWVDPSIARQCLAILRGKRGQTIQALKSQTVDLRPQNSISPWFIWSWLQAVHDSSGATKQPEVELIEFIGTFGKAGAPHNPITLGYFENYSTPSIGARTQRENGVGAQILFDASLTAEEREDWHYISQPAQNPFIGLKLHGFSFQPTVVIFDFHPTGGTVYKGPQNLKLEMRNGKEFHTQTITVDTEGSAIMEVKNRFAFNILKVEMVGNKDDAILRATGLKVGGLFLPEIEGELG